MGRRHRGERALGPYPYRGRWRIFEVAADGKRTSVYFEKESEAKGYVKAFNEEVEHPELDTDSARKLYLEHLAITKGNEDTSLKTTESRLKQFFPDAIPLWALSTKRCQRLYDDLQKRISKRTKKPPAVDTHRNARSEAQTFLGWCCHRKRRWIRTNPLADVEGVGRRRKGKKQLKLGTARIWYRKALDLANGGDEGAIAALFSIMLGMRATEIVTRRVHDLDTDREECDLIWIPRRDTKSDAGERTLELRDPLRTLVVALTEGKDHTAPLFYTLRSKSGLHDRDWVCAQVERICTLAGVDIVTTHGMRGLFGTIAVGEGLATELVAKTLGHEDTRTTMESYVDQKAAERAASRARLRLLEGGKK